jgi:nucleoside 2-deoxyribosyltransferase
MKIYISGPEVFLENAVEVLEAKRKLCEVYGHEGLTPFDTNIEEIVPTWSCGYRIGLANEALMNVCDVVISNITPFRGISADPGTVYEIGYARAKGKRVFAYSYDTRSHEERIKAYYGGKTEPDGKGFERGVEDRLTIENFKMWENLMIDAGVAESGGSVQIVLNPKGPSDFGWIAGFEICLKHLSGVIV